MQYQHTLTDACMQLASNIILFHSNPQTWYCILNILFLAQRCEKSKDCFNLVQPMYLNLKIVIRKKSVEIKTFQTFEIVNRIDLQFLDNQPIELVGQYFEESTFQIEFEKYRASIHSKFREIAPYLQHSYPYWNYYFAAIYQKKAHMLKNRNLK